jgi:hypothetical protein
MTSSPNAPERAIESRAEDKLERSQFIERLTLALVNSSTGKSTGLVIGITGPWGSGKSSILNLLHEHLKGMYEDALIVRFDPWLVSGRDDLIAEFLGELIGTINANQSQKDRFKKLVAKVAEYGAQLAPVSNLLVPGMGAIASGGFKALQTAFSEKMSLNALRVQLKKELEELDVPVVVLIDEIDRVEDGEIRTVAQLVRSVVDFRGISYVLAYDPDRVIEALGAGKRESGRAYLEKIVQLQIPIPVTFDNEIIRLLTANLNALETALQLPQNFAEAERFEVLMQLLAGDVIRTPRDIRRLTDTFHVLIGMLHGEVDWIDLLAYSALLIKAPATIAKMRQDPDEFLNDSLSSRSLVRYIEKEQIPLEEQLTELIPKSEINEGNKALLRYLFPSFTNSSNIDHEHSDALADRRPFLTTLRLGLLPGAFSRDEVVSLIRSEPDQIAAKLQKALDRGVLAELIDRLNDLYVNLDAFNHVSFWKGVAAFAKKADCEWMTFYQPMNETVGRLSSILLNAIERDNNLRKEAAAIFTNLMNASELELTAHWLRRHIFIYGLYGRQKSAGDDWFLNFEQTDALANTMACDWRLLHLSGKLIPCLWGLQPVYTMIDTGVWDDPCRKMLESMLENGQALDGFTLMLFGPGFRTDKATIAKICNYEVFIELVRSRLASVQVANIHPSACVALKEAILPL